MENAANALKIGAWFLIFVIALAITITSFTQARQSIDTIVANMDREYVTTYVEQSTSTQRHVNYEYIIPAIYRAFNENYKIVFKDKNGNDIVLYTKIGINTTDKTDINYIDLEKENITENSREEFIKRILYGNSKFQSADDVKYTKSHFPNIEFKDDGIYNRLLNKTYVEKLGVYYQEETDGGKNTPDANKTEKRVITYIEQ